jgi:cell wall-associated NlpC family hydrolase
MSMVDTIGTISQIQATLTRLNAPAAPKTPATASTAQTSGTFAQALSAAGIPNTAGTVPSAVPATGTATGQEIADDARKYLGVPYVWGGTDPATGLDCSGLVQHVYKDLGIDLPRVAIDQGNAGATVPNLAAAQPGDLLVMNGGQHIGIYMGNNQYIHAPAPGQAVQIQSIPAGAVFDKIARIIPAATATAATVQPGGTADLLSTLQASLATGRAA